VVTIPAIVIILTVESHTVRARIFYSSHTLHTPVVFFGKCYL